MVPADRAEREASFTASTDPVALMMSSNVAAWSVGGGWRALGAGLPVYQWTASHGERVNTLEVRGRLQVGGGHYEVTCRIARGARAHYAAIEIVENVR